MSPPLEKEKDRACELRAAARVARWLGMTHEKLDRFNHLDHVFVDKQGVPRVIAEIKCRSERYDTVFSLRKLIELLQWRTWLLPAFVARWPDDEMRIIRAELILGMNLTPGYLGRYDRNLTNDREPIVEVPVDQMVIIP